MSRQRRRVVGAVIVVAVLAIALAAMRLRGSSTTQAVVASSDLGDPSCSRDDAGQADLGVTVTASVFRGPDVSDAAIDAQLARAAGYFAPYSVSLARSAANSTIDDRWMVGGTKAEIDEALRGAGIDPNAPPSEADAPRMRAIVCDVALAPLKRFMARHGRGAEPQHVNVVIMRRLAAPGSTAAGMLPNLRGLTIAPGATLAAELLACVGLDERSVPTVLVSVDEIADRRPGTVDVTLAHELGHVLGLAHADRPDDLMSVQPPTCVPPLSRAQLERIAAGPFTRTR